MVQPDFATGIHSRNFTSSSAGCWMTRSKTKRRRRLLCRCNGSSESFAPIEDNTFHDRKALLALMQRQALIHQFKWPVACSICWNRGSERMERKAGSTINPLNAGNRRSIAFCSQRYVCSLSPRLA